MFASHVAQWSTADGRQVLWNRLTGRHVAIDPASIPAAQAPGPLRQRLASLGMFADPMLERMALVVCRSKLPLLRPDGPSLWVPVPHVRTAGGSAWRVLPLEPLDLAIWLSANDARTVDDVVRLTGARVGEVFLALERFCDPDVQAIQLRERAPQRNDPSLRHTVSVPRPENLRTRDQRGGEGETSLVAYHLAITDGDVHFDNRETTIAHAHGIPHPALGGRRFGEALIDVIGPQLGDGVILEVGCGDGELAQAVLDRVPGLSQRYIRVDLSPELLATQRRRVPQTREVLANAIQLPFRDASVGAVLSNEVIADMTAAPWHPELPPGPIGREVTARIAKYGLTPLPGSGPYNLGAWQFIEEIARVLRPGGFAYVSEFGTLDEAPEEASQLDHPEVSIHFGHLQTLARALGLRADVVRLDEWLNVDLGARQLARAHHEGLRAMCRAVGHHLPARAWTPDQLAKALPWRVECLDWVPVSEPGAGPLFTRFYALLLVKPTA